MAIHTSSDIIAQRYVVSSSVSHITASAASGSTISGDSAEDKHQFTGSLSVKTLASTADFVVTGSKVGVGLAAPAQPLHVITPNNGGIEIDAAAGAPTLFFDVPGNEQGRIYFQEDDTVMGGIVYESTGTDYISFKLESNTERMRLLGSEKLTIGTNFNNNSGVLNIAPSSGTAPTMYFEQYTSATDGTLGEISFGNRAVDGQLALIQVKNDGANDSAYMAFHTEVTSGALTERLRINSSGNVGIGNASPTKPLQVTGDISQSGDFYGPSGLTINWLNANTRIAGSNSGGYLQFDVGGISNVLKLTSTKISGSYTTTGSFGALGIGAGAPAGTRAVDIRGEMMIQSVGGESRFYMSGTADDEDGQLYIYDDSAAYKIKLNAGGDSFFTGGNVGIGTASPISSGVRTSLHIYGNHTSNNTILKVEQDGAMSSALIQIDSAADRDTSLYFQENGTTKATIFNDASTDTFILTDGANTNTLYITGSKVGIGTTSPVTPLHVNSDGSSNGIMSNQILRITPADGNNGINIGSDGTDGMIGVTNNDTDLHFLSRTGGSYSKAMTIDGATGKIGIGTTSPDRLLHVHKASAGTVTAVSYTEFVIEDDGGSGMSILAPDANSGNIVFGFPSDNDSVQLRAYYNGGNPRLAVELAASEKFNFIGNQFSGSASSTGSFARYHLGNGQVISNNSLGSNRFEFFNDGGLAAIVSGSGNKSIIATNLNSVPAGAHGLYAHTDIGDARITVDSATSSDAQLKFVNGGSDSWTIYSDGSDSGDPLRFYDSGDSSIMMTLVGGKVGIGVTSPTEKLTVAVPQTSGNTLYDVLRITTTGTYDSGGSSGAGGSISFGQYFDTYPNWQVASIGGTRNGASWDGALHFYTNEGSGQEALTEKVRIKSNGDLLLISGSISGSSTSTGSFGSLIVADKVQGNLTLGGTNIPTLHLDGLVDAVVRIDKAASYRAAHLRFDTAGSADWFIGTPDSDTYGDGDELYFGTSADTPIVAIDPNASTGLLNLTSNKISGSLTSTGSFGHVIIPGKMVVGHPNILTITSGSSLQINDRGSTTVGLDLRHVTNDTGKGFIIRNLASNQGGDVVEYGRIKNEIIGRVDGSHSGAYRFSLAHEGTVTERLTILNGGQVGISETSPQTKLHILESSAAPALTIDQSTQQQYSGLRIRTNRGDAGSYDSNWDIFDSGGDNLRFAYGLVSPSTYGNLGAGGDIRMVIDGSSGNVEFPTANAKISGSSTSTGSFSRLDIGRERNNTAAVNITSRANNNTGGFSLQLDSVDAASLRQYYDGTNWVIASTYGTQGGLYSLTVMGSAGSGNGLKVMRSTYAIPGAVGISAGLGTGIVNMSPAGALHVSSSTMGDALVVSGSGGIPRVGIGTTSPSKALVVESTTGYDGIEVRATNAVARIANGSADDGYISLLKAGTGKVQIHSGGDTYFNSSSQKVGIGTTSPQVGLDIHADTTETVAVFGQADDGDAYIATRVGEVQNRRMGYIFQVGSAAVAGYGSVNTTATITSHVLNDGGTLKGDLRFSTNTGDSLQRRLTITDDGQISGSLNSTGSFGQLQIGHTPTHGQSNADIAHTVSIANHTDNSSGAFLFISAQQTVDGNLGHIDFCNNANTDSDKRIAEISSRRVDENNSGQLDFVTKNAGSWVSAFRMAKNGDLTATDTTIGSISDERTKQNIQTYSGSLSMVNTLRPVTFEWKSNRKKSGIQRGFVAQEITSSDAYWVRTEKVNENQEDYEYLGDATGSREALVSKLTEKDTMYVSAIQELTQAVRDLRAMITGSTDLNQLKAQVSSSSFV